MSLLGLVATGCRPKGALGGAHQAFDSSRPIEITGFQPDSGGIATQMIIDGKNFGSDTTGLRVYFVDSLGQRHRAGLVSSNGEKLYLTVPKLTYLRTLKIQVERMVNDQTYTSSSKDDMPFLYTTGISVATVIGQASTDNALPTKAGTFASATLSAPSFLAIDDEDNIFITERNFQTGIVARNDKGEGDGNRGNILLADTKKQELIVLRYLNPVAMNGPTFSNIPGEEAIFIPEDPGKGFLRLRKGANYSVQRQFMLFTDGEPDPFNKNNWKHSIAFNKADQMLYTIAWTGELIRINPKTRQSQVLIDKVVPDVPNENGGNGSDNFYIFSPLEPMVMYVALCNYNMIKRIDLRKIPEGDRTSYRGENYAGLATSDGAKSGKGWEDGPLLRAKFNNPTQLAFTADGKLYIADRLNHCVRVIDTTVSPETAVVNTAVGIPGSAGFRDGGPDQALFNNPSGVAVNSDGSVLYVADHKNHVIRKLAIQ